jgi:hypothetical protein
MKLRSSILFGCLLFVPMVAMFSHKIPRGVREGFRDRVWRPAVDRVSAWVAGEADRGGQAVERSAFAPVAPVEPQPSAAPATATVSPMAVLPTAPAAAPPVALAPVTVQSTLLPQPSRGALEERLAAVGAVGLKLKQPEGPMGVHVASCRVPADASGQLQRLFQASGPTPEASLERLAVQIETWRSRVASAAAPLR